MEEIFISLVVFGGIYFIIKVFTDFLLKKKLINAGHVNKTDILEPAQSENSYPTLKWGLVTLFGGAGLLLISQLDQGMSMENITPSSSFLQFGIELIAISLGFLLYFVLMRVIKK